MVLGFWEMAHGLSGLTMATGIGPVKPGPILPEIYLTIMLLVAKFGQYKMMPKNLKMTETLTHGYSFESTQRELSYEYLHDRV